MYKDNLPPAEQPNKSIIYFDSASGMEWTGFKMRILSRQKFAVN
jgi:hypothetical protein